MKKHITCHSVTRGTAEEYQHKVRKEIASFKAILDKFYTDEGFDEFMDRNTVEVRVGDDSAKTYFAPRTWEAVEAFCMFTICHLIEDNDLEVFPYYDELLSAYSKNLNIERGNFT